MMTRLDKVASKAFGSRAPKISWIDFGRIKGSKPRMVGMIEVPFQINHGDGSTTASSAKSKGVKP